MGCRNCLKYNGKACELGLAFPCGAYVPHIITPLERVGDLISRSAAKEKFQECFGSVYISKVTDAFFDEIPSVDAVPVVRCKDCKHWDCYGGEDSHKGDCSELPGLECCMYEDDFCSSGERKTP